MSYILDALKKAEQKRHLGAKVPTLTTVHRRPAPAAPARPIWPWIAGAVILANAGAVLWLLRPTPIALTGGAARSTQAPALSPPPSAPEQPATARPVEPAAIPVTPPEKPVTVAVAPPPAISKPARARPVETNTMAPATPAPIASRAALPKPKPADAHRAPPISAPKASAPAGAPPASLGATAPEKVATAPQKGAVTTERPAIQAMARGPEKPLQQGAGPSPTPQSAQGAAQDIPKMQLQMLVYSDVPSERLVFIDGHKYIEGSSIDGKLVVESITPEGAMLSYQGKRFLLRQ